MDTLRIPRNISSKDLFLILLNIYNLGYGELNISGYIKNLLEADVRPLLTLISKEIEIYLTIDSGEDIPFELLKFDIKGLNLKTKDVYLLDYLQQSFPLLRITNE